MWLKIFGEFARLKQLTGAGRVAMQVSSDGFEVY